MQYTMPIQSAGRRYHPIVRRLIILAILIPADACSEQTTKAMFGEARQRLWIVINFQVGDMPRKQLRRRFSVGVQFSLMDARVFDGQCSSNHIVMSKLNKRTIHIGRKIAIIEIITSTMPLNNIHLAASKLANDAAKSF